MVFEFCKGEAVFRVAIALANDAVDLSVFLEHLSELPFDLDDIRLGQPEFTFPSMLVMKSLLVGSFSSERDLSLRLPPLDSLLSYILL